MQKQVQLILDNINSLILGKDGQIKLALACLIAKGHLLIEDLPGMGKTTLAHVMASVLGLGFQRIQFTSDLLPADILGAAIYHREREAFEFHPGPIFSQLILADEVNRATPKTQSALLEAMEEHQVTIEGETRQLPEPFFVIATQNPTQQIGTYALPESQLDRFLMRIELGYPNRLVEKELLLGKDRRELLSKVQRVIAPDKLQLLQKAAERCTTSDALIDYVVDLIHNTREHNQLKHGLSPRGGLALLRCAKAWAFMHGRDFVLPEDVQAVFPSVAIHRLEISGNARGSVEEIVEELLATTRVPT